MVQVMLDAQSFNLDEYVDLPRDHEQSYWTFMHENLFHGIDIKEENVHVPYGKTKEDCEAYEKSMENVTVDIQVLGMEAMDTSVLTNQVHHLMKKLTSLH